MVLALKLRTKTLGGYYYAGEYPARTLLTLTVPHPTLLGDLNMLICHDCLYPTCPGCGWVNAQPEYIDFVGSDAAPVSCLKCGLEHTVTRQTVFTYTSKA